RIDPDFRRERKMDETDETQALSLAFDLIRHRAERQTIDRHQRVIRTGRERPRGAVERRPRWVRKVFIQLAHIHSPAVRAKAADDAAVVFIAAGAGRESAGHDEHQTWSHEPISHSLLARIRRTTRSRRATR